MQNPSRFLTAAYYKRKQRQYLTREGWRQLGDRNRLRRLRNRHKGESCFIIGNGPSLNASDLEKIADYPTFACNKIFLIFERTNWRPTYYFVEDQLVWEQEKGKILGIEEIQRFAPDIEGRFSSTDFTIFKQLYNYNQTKEVPYSKDPIEGLEWGGTVCFSMIQMAHHMGFSSIVLLGVDFSYSSSTTVKFNTEYIDKKEAKSGCDHFSPDYYKEGVPWIPPDMAIQEKAFKIAYEETRRDGIKLINASRKSALNVVPKQNLEAVIAASK